MIRSTPINRFFGFISTWLVLVVCPAGLAEINQLAFTEPQLKQLEQGEVVFLKPDGNDMLKAVIRIETPAEPIWKVMLDHERVLKYVEELRECQIIEQGDNWKIIEHRLKMSSFLPTFHYVFREEYGSDYSISFERLRGAFKTLTGSWKLYEEEDEACTYLVYSTLVEFGWLIPNSWVRKGIDKRVPQLLKAFREEVYSDGIKASPKDDSQ